MTLYVKPCVCFLFTEPCNTTTDDIRIAPLNDSEPTYRGRLEVCRADGWMEVCEKGWNTSNAKVACRQLGYTESSEAK